MTKKCKLCEVRLEEGVQKPDLCDECKNAVKQSLRKYSKEFKKNVR